MLASRCFGNANTEFRLYITPAHEHPGKYSLAPAPLQRFQALSSRASLDLYDRISYPLNLIGIVTPGRRLPALPGNRLLLKDGVPIAVRNGKQIEYLHNVRCRATMERASSVDGTVQGSHRVDGAGWRLNENA